jgi:hypothetical protein
LNVQRLKEYKERLVVFPRRNNKIKNGDATKAEIAESKLDTSSVNIVPAAAAAVTFAPITEVRLFEKYQYIKWYLITEVVVYGVIWFLRIKCVSNGLYLIILFILLFVGAKDIQSLQFPPICPG